jgi:CRISPR-associated protein Cmr2
MTERYFHFTLGPVQGFVAQARRTRDFWAGSFLLSWLSGVAMAATESLCGAGAIEFPAPAEGYLDWIRGHGQGGEGPRIGAIPNRFMAKVPKTFRGEVVAQAVRDAWWALAQEVWQRDGLENHGASHDVWKRQHRHFWDISWVLTDGPEESSALDCRKNWRAHLPPEEPGVKCHLMEGWQELSGIVPMDGESNAKRRAFWQSLRNAGNGSGSDLNEGEMLCAIAYVKRRFVRVFEKFQPAIELGAVGTLTLQGWKLNHSMPSVAYMAAVHWLEALVKNANPGELRTLHDLAHAAGAHRDEWDTWIRCLEEALPKQAERERKEAREAIALDGNIFFDYVLEAPHRYGYKGKEANRVRNWLKSFWDSRAEVKKPPLSPFYAVLMMDGDSLGAHMSKPGNQKPIADALNEFTERVRGIVEGHNGMLIYAGGDDVLALLPLEDALNCAAELHGDYRTAFAGHIPEGCEIPIPTTLSGAVIFAHVKTALGEVLRQAHLVLDDIAKDGAGRDAIAIRVLKPGGEHLTWAQPWKVALDSEGRLVLADIADRFGKPAETGAGEFSSKFFYKMRHRFEVLKGMKPGEVESLLAADYLASEPPGRESGQASMKMDDAKRIIGPLLEQCRPAKREPDQPRKQWRRGEAEADAALLVRFLATKGVEVR